MSDVEPSAFDIYLLVGSQEKIRGNILRVYVVISVWCPSALNLKQVNKSCGELEVDLFLRSRDL